CLAPLQCPPQSPLFWIDGRECTPNTAGNTRLIGNIVKCGTVFVIDHIVKRRHIETAADACESKQYVIPAVLVDDRINELIGENLALADSNYIGKICDRFRIEKRCGSAHYDQGVILVTLFGPNGYIGKLKHPC